jgi:hypothetical protein
MISVSFIMPMYGFYNTSFLIYWTFVTRRQLLSMGIYQGYFDKKLALTLSSSVLVFHLYIIIFKCSVIKWTDFCEICSIVKLFWKCFNDSSLSIELRTSHHAMQPTPQISYNTFQFSCNQTEITSYCVHTASLPISTHSLASASFCPPLLQPLVPDY